MATSSNAALPLNGNNERIPAEIATGVWHILLVDDDRLVLATLKQGLSKMGYTVTTCDNGPDALELYRNNPPDLVVLDVRMSGMSGIETARAMLESAYRPILMLSAYDDQVIVKEAVTMGVAGYLVKPIEANQMAPSIEAALARFAEVEALITNHEKLSRQASLNQEAMGLSSVLDIEKTIHRILLGGQCLANAEVGGIAFYDQRNGCFKHWMFEGLPEDFVSRIAQDLNNFVGGIDDTAFRSHRDPLAVPFLALGSLMQGRGIRASIYLPIVFNDIRLGVMLLYSRNRDAFPPEQCELLNTYVQLSAKALDNARLYAEMAELARTDSLTGLANRHLAEERLQQEFQRSRRYADQFSIVLLDIDSFKRINDVHGHAAGDSVLKDFSRILAYEIRDVDVAARYGGDEFMLILPHTDSAGAMLGNRAAVSGRNSAGDTSARR
jgi:GGDEF domain-containing protein/CheY-like chemotaxis protein